MNDPTHSAPAVVVRGLPEPGGALDASVRLRIVTAVFGGVWGFGMLKAVTSPAWAERAAELWNLRDFDRLVTVGLALSAVCVIVSAVVFVGAWRKRMSRDSLVRYALGFGVFGTLTFAFGETQVPFEPGQLRPLLWTPLWMLFFPLVVPGRRREVTIAVVLAVLMVPLGLALSVASGMPAPPGVAVALIVAPVLIAALMSMAPIAAIHQMQCALDASEATARRLGSYRLEQKLGEGGMGEVWRASHAMLQRPAALKLVRVDGEQERLARFEREANVTADLHDPHTVQVYDYGVAADGRLRCVAYWLLTGRMVFERPTAVAVILAHCTDPPPELDSEFEVPDGLRDLVIQLLAKSPDDRPGTASEVRRRLLAIGIERPWNEPRAQEWWEVHHPHVG